jgi:lipopolysaccharide/colanic/teichoic acid biosynthesis glycosyltransferase
LAIENLKRLFDILGAIAGILVLLPFALLVALVIKISDRGPVFYRQTRVGRFGKPFRIWKFRSMVLNAEKLGGSLTKEEDPRITRIGRLLRKSKFDELPQLWNVLMGEMSFVGPRPEVPRYVDLYRAEQREILNYRPGITDLATMLFRNEEALLRGTEDVEGFYVRHCLPKKIELNLDYAKRAGVLHDLWIIFQTLCPYWVSVLVLYSMSLATSFWLTYQLRSDFQMSAADYAEFRRTVAWMVAPQVLLLMWRGQIRGLMSYFSIPEMRRTAAALIGALLIQAAIGYLVYGRLTPSRSILLMDCLLSFFSLCAVRMGVRLLRERSGLERQTRSSGPWRVAIVGTGDLATNLALDFLRSETGNRRVVAFFDDNPRNWNKRPHDIPVVGMPECLLNPEWSERLDEIVVALPNETPERVQEISDILNALPVKVTFASNWPVLHSVAD